MGLSLYFSLKQDLNFFFLEFISEFFELYLIGHGGESSVDHGIIGGGKAIKIKAFILVSLYEEGPTMH